jgi:hypothetical protein
MGEGPGIAADLDLHAINGLDLQSDFAVSGGFHVNGLSI